MFFRVNWFLYKGVARVRKGLVQTDNHQLAEKLEWSLQKLKRMRPILKKKLQDVMVLNAFPITK